MSVETQNAGRPARPRPDVVVHIKPARGVGFGDFVGVMRYSQLLFGMVRRSIRARFDNLYLGVFWAIARPLLMMFVFVFLKHLSAANMGSEISYPAYLFSGLVIWFYVAASITQTASALSRDAGLVQKVYFPRLISPLTPMLANLVDLAVGAVVLVPIMILSHLWPDWKIILLPLVLLQTMAFILGTGLIFAALGLMSRDWNNLLGLLLYIGLFLSPVAYTVKRLSGVASYIYSFNPLAGTLTAIRACLFAPLPFPWELWGYSVAFSLVALLLGLLMFRKVEHKLLDQL